jgi:PAS domain S-box-containing protein
MSNSILQSGPLGGPASESVVTAPSRAVQLAGIFAVLPDAILYLDRSWRIVYANPEAVRLSRLSQEELEARDFWQVWPDLIGSELERRYRDAMELRQAERFEFHYEPFDMWVDIHLMPTGDGLAICYRDISSRKIAERREQEAARRLAEVLELTSDGVFTLDRNWNYTFLNRSAQRLIERGDSLLGKNVWQEFPWAVGGPSWVIYHRSMNEGLPGEIVAPLPGPSDRWLVIHSEPAPEGIVVFFRDVTEERRHDRIVQAQRELLESVQQSARLATWEFDLTTGNIAWGPGSFEIYGHPLDQVATLTQLEAILLPGHADRMRAQIEECKAPGITMMLEYAVASRDGSIVWIESRGTLFRAPGSGALRMRGVALDVTQRHLDQQELVASEARYRVLADLNPQAIWMGDPEGNIIYSNQEFRAYIGEDFSSGGPWGWIAAFAPEDRERVRSSWTHSYTTGSDYDIEARLQRGAGGTYRWWHLRAAPVRDMDGSILHWLGVGHDIDETKTYTATLRAEQIETERRREELETIYKTSPVGLALLDPVHFTFLNLNDHEAEMLGAPKERIVGRPLSEIAPPEKVPHLFDLLQLAAGGTPVLNRLLEGELASRPGERRAWSVNYAPIYNEDGTIRAISTASLEITHQKKAEAALIESEKLAAVGRLASSISHEINNPLEAITNLLYLISLSDDLPEETRLYVNMAQSELSRVSQIATQTLRFHRQAVAPTFVTARQLVEDVIRLYTGRLANSRILVEAQYRTETQMLCFENDIRQVLNNLIANAIDAMRHGGRLLVRAHRGQLGHGERSRPGVRITIADTGHGMSQTVLARVFEAFFTTKDLNGTGLGLWISTGIIERHQGRIRVRSSDLPGRSGTVFMLFVPCEE